MGELNKRDLVGYGRNVIDPKWPGNAKLALNIVLNYEEGAEYCILNGDRWSETMLSEVVAQPIVDGRNLNVESSYEYGSRVGVWRILKLFSERDWPLTIYAVGSALQDNPAVAEETARMGCDYVGHGWRWIDYNGMPMDQERDHINRCVEAIKALTGKRPLGWCTGRPSVNTRRLVIEEGGFLYDSDSISDDLPYWVTIDEKKHRVICHTFDTNDGRFSRGQGFVTAKDWFTYVKDAFDWLYWEGNNEPKLMTVALHCRMIGRPGRISALSQFLEYVAHHDSVWLCHREDIARHWHANHKG